MYEKLTAVFKKSSYGYIGYIEEIPGANTQGKTIEETRNNLIEAFHLILDANRRLFKEENRDVEVIKEDFGAITV